MGPHVTTCGLPGALSYLFSHTTEPKWHDGINANFISSFLHYLDLRMLVNVKQYVSWQKGLPFKVADFIGLFNFEWHSQNDIGIIGILVLWRDREKLVLTDCQSIWYIKLITSKLYTKVWDVNLHDIKYWNHSLRCWFELILAQLSQSSEAAFFLSEGKVLNFLEMSLFFLSCSVVVSWMLSRVTKQQ